jgi:hypothetical protein
MNRRCPNYGLAIGMGLGIVVLHILGMRLQWTWLDLTGGAAAFLGLMFMAPVGKVRVVRAGLRQTFLLNPGVQPHGLAADAW